MAPFIFLAEILIPLVPSDLISQNVVQRPVRKGSPLAQHLCEAPQGAETHDRVSMGGPYSLCHVMPAKCVTTLLTISAHEDCSSCEGEIIACLKSNLLKPNELKMYANILLLFSPLV